MKFFSSLKPKPAPRRPRRTALTRKVFRKQRREILSHLNKFHSQFSEAVADLSHGLANLQSQLEAMTQEGTQQPRPNGEGWEEYFNAKRKQFEED